MVQKCSNWLIWLTYQLLIKKLSFLFQSLINSCGNLLVVLARDQMKEMGYEKEEYKERGPGEITETILRYDMNLTYYIRG